MFEKTIHLPSDGAPDQAWRWRLCCLQDQDGSMFERTLHLSDDEAPYPSSEMADILSAGSGWLHVREDYHPTTRDPWPVAVRELRGLVEERLATSVWQLLSSFPSTTKKRPTAFHPLNKHVPPHPLAESCVPLLFLSSSSAPPPSPPAPPPTRPLRAMR